MKKKYQVFGIWGLFFVGILILLVNSRNNATTAATAGEQWLTDFEKARQTAAEQDKDLLINFAGSDWCYWCKRLDREVFAKPVFEQEAGEAFVFVLVDFPNDKSHQTADQQQQNKRLAQRYGVTGFPTIFLADADGVPYAKTGYLEGGAQRYVEHLKALKDSKGTP
jgi:thioredoxin-related protein